MSIHSQLGHFTGSQEWTSAGPLFPNVIYSEGAVFLAENVGAFWLLEAIASHLVANPKLKAERKRNPAFNYLHFWKLQKKGDGAVLSAVEDSGMKPVVQQEIEYTDFPFPESGDFVLYVGNDGPNTYNKIFLPSEY